MKLFSLCFILISIASGLCCGRKQPASGKLTQTAPALISQIDSIAEPLPYPENREDTSLVCSLDTPEAYVYEIRGDNEQSWDLVFRQGHKWAVHSYYGETPINYLDHASLKALPLPGLKKPALVFDYSSEAMHSYGLVDDSIDAGGWSNAIRNVSVWNTDINKQLFTFDPHTGGSSYEYEKGYVSVQSFDFSFEPDGSILFRNFKSESVKDQGEPRIKEDLKKTRRYRFVNDTFVLTR